MSEQFPSTRHFEYFVTDRVVEEPWVISKVGEGQRVLDVGSATSRYLETIAAKNRVVAIDLRPTPPHPSIAAIRGDVTRAPFPPETFDVITCISTVEHAGLDVYGQGPDQFGDELLMRYMRSLLRPGGRLLLTAPFGKRAVAAWLRVYDPPTFRRLTGGFRPIAIEYRRRDGDAYVPCEPDEIKDATFDWIGVRSNGVVLAELAPEGGPAYAFARMSLRVRRYWGRLRHRRRHWRFWDDVF